jgi:hypothetical protein
MHATIHFLMKITQEGLRRDAAYRRPSPESRFGEMVGSITRALFARNARLLAMAFLATSSLLMALGNPSTASAQSNRKPPRAAPPKFVESDSSGIFYDDIRTKLTGAPPRIGTKKTIALSGSTAKPTTSIASESTSKWPQQITATSIEDLAKAAKLRVDKLVTTPARYAGGVYAQARREFALLAMLFGIIEQYDGDVRWRTSATDARQLFARATENSRTGDSAAFNDAKARKQDLADLLRGTKIDSGMPKSDLVWSETVDRDSLMELLEWSLRDQLQPSLASESDFEKQSEAVRRFAELIAAMGVVAADPTMPDGDDDDYIAFANAMTSHAQEIVAAVDSNRWEDARAAMGQVDQSCSACHENYR